jgi:hypothetical protein
VYQSTWLFGNPRFNRRFGKIHVTLPAALTTSVAASTSRISWSRRASATPLRKTSSEARHRRGRAGTKLSSANAIATKTPTAAMATPETTTAVARLVAQPSSPSATMPAADPTSSQRARAVSTRSMRSGRASSSVTHATSAPLERPQPKPHSSCVTRSSGKAVTTPVITMPAARNRWPRKSGHFRPIVSDQTPVGMSERSNAADTAVPSRTSCDAVRCAWMTKYRLETSTYPRWKTARMNAQRRNVVATSCT